MKWTVKVEGRIVVDAPDKEGAQKVAQGLLVKYAPWLEAQDGYNIQAVADESDMEAPLLQPET